MIHTDKGLNRVPVASLKPINSYVIVLKLIDPQFYRGDSSIYIPESFKTEEAGIGIAMSRYYENSEKVIDIGDPVVYGKHNTVNGLDDVLFLPENLSAMLETIFKTTQLSKLGTYNKNQCSFTIIHYHGLFALLKDDLEL